MNANMGKYTNYQFPSQRGIDSSEFGTLNGYLPAKKKWSFAAKVELVGAMILLIGVFFLFFKNVLV